MPDHLRALRLGPSLYMPALHRDLVAVGNGKKYPDLRTVIFCTEDSTLERDLPRALDNLAEALPRLETSGLTRYIRPRGPALLSRLLRFKGMERIDGFVIPKADLDTLPEYFSLLEGQRRFSLMITLETRSVFDLGHLYRLRDYLAASPLRERIVALRIGAQDLLSCLGLRREPDTTIYETPLGLVIDQILTTFRPAGFALTAPAFEYFCAPDLLRREIAADISRGLFSKTALQPEQLPVIASAYQVPPQDLEAARAVLNPDLPAVFRLHDRMYEKAVHTHWARALEHRAGIYGTSGRILEEGE